MWQKSTTQAKDALARWQALPQGRDAAIIGGIPSTDRVPCHRPSDINRMPGPTGEAEGHLHSRNSLHENRH
jgi:hypothetical protein